MIKKAAPEISEDFNKILKELGAKDFKSITREQHEQFAESLEIYLKEGKAPTKELQSTFRRFARWLGIIYDAINSF